MNNKQSGFSHVALVLLSVIIFGLCIFVGSRISSHQASKKDDSFFKQLTVNAQGYWIGQSKALGIEGSKEDVDKHCYRAEQGPFDHGDLWCGLRVNKKITVQPDTSYVQQLLTALSKVVESQGFKVYEDGSRVYGKSVSFDAGKQEAPYGESKCSSRVNYEPQTAYPDATTTITYQLDCSKQSSHIPTDFHCDDNIRNATCIDSL